MPAPTPSDLASYLKQDVDTSTATLALSVAEALFQQAANTKFAVTSATYQVEGRGQPVISIPRGPLVAIAQVRLDGVVLASTEYTQVMANLYRVIGWGRVWGSTVPTAPYVGFPPQLVEVDYTYGYTDWPLDVFGAVLETAGAAYMGPDITLTAETIDDYSAQYSRNAGGVQLSPAAALLAERYRTSGFA